MVVPPYHEVDCVILTELRNKNERVQETHQTNCIDTEIALSVLSSKQFSVKRFSTGYSLFVCPLLNPGELMKGGSHELLQGTFQAL
jgi:hypothetical protein